MRCPKCGFINKEDVTLCKKCGAELEEKDSEKTLSFPPPEAEEKEALVEVEPQEVATLIVTKGPVIGQKFVLDKKEITIGRAPQSDIFLNDITVSRKHAKIVFEGDKAIIMDMGSLNGTYLNRRRIEKAVLKHGDEFQIGKFKLVYAARRV